MSLYACGVLYYVDVLMLATLLDNSRYCCYTNPFLFILLLLSLDIRVVHFEGSWSHQNKLLKSCCRWCWSKGSGLFSLFLPCCFTTRFISSPVSTASPLRFPSTTVATIFTWRRRYLTAASTVMASALDIGVNTAFIYLQWSCWQWPCSKQGSQRHRFL